MSPETVRHTLKAAPADAVLRQVARFQSDRFRVFRVELLALRPDDPLASAKGEENIVECTLESGRTFIRRGRGAGRWPTAESVIGDLLELSRGPKRTYHQGDSDLSRPVPICYISFAT